MKKEVPHLVMKPQREYEKGSPAFGDETATEYFTDYFNRFWGRG